MAVFLLEGKMEKEKNAKADKTEQEIVAVKKRATDEEIAEALKATGGIYKAAAQWLWSNKFIRINRETIGRRVKKSETLQEAEEEAKEHMLDVAENGLLRAIAQGKLAAIIFYLKCKGKKRGYVERQEISAEVSAEVKKTNPFEGMTLDEIKALAHAKPAD